MGLLLVNHAELAGDREAQAALLAEARALFLRVREESGDVRLAQQAVNMEALCALTAGDAATVIDLLGDTAAPAMAPEALIASALQGKGQPEEAKTVLQVGIYQSIVLLFNYLPSYMTLSAGDPPRFDEALRRALAVSDAFDMRRLHPAVLVGLYLVAAQGFMQQGKPDRAVDMLRQYADIVTGDIYPLRLKGDGFFDRLDGWLEELDLGTGLPRNERTIRRSMTDAVIQNPAFTALKDDLVFRGVEARLIANAPEQT